MEKIVYKLRSKSTGLYVSQGFNSWFYRDHMSENGHEYLLLRPALDALKKCLRSPIRCGQRDLDIELVKVTYLIKSIEPVSE